MEHVSDIDELIAKHLTGEILTEEQTRLENWLAQSEKNRQYYRQMEQLWQKSLLGKMPFPRSLDVEAALASTKAKMKQAPLAKRVNIQFWRYGIAAALLLFIGAFWFFQQNSANTETVLAASSNTLRDTLSDGSLVAITQHSSLSAVYSRKARNINMRGEAYFEVAPNPEKPFVVKVQDVEVTVLGTKFNIDNRTEPDWVIVSVVEGKVRVQSGKQTEYLTAGEQLRMHRGDGKSVRTQTKPADNVSAWASRQFVFDDMPLSEVIPLLEKAYQVKIHLSNAALEKCRLYVRFNNESIDRIIALIADTFSLEIRNINGQFYLDGSGCDR